MTRFSQLLVIGFLGGAVVAAVGAVLLLRDSIPELTSEALATAKERWRENGPADYDLRLTTEGELEGRYFIEVRGGKVRRLNRDEKWLRQRGTEWSAWTVPGMLEVMEMDLATRKDSGDSANLLKLNAEFDPQNGVPTRYRRISMGENRGRIEWQVESFQAL